MLILCFCLQGKTNCTHRVVIFHNYLDQWQISSAPEQDEEQTKGGGSPLCCVRGKLTTLSLLLLLG
jgi:hypothetical protein